MEQPLVKLWQYVQDADNHMEVMRRINIQILVLKFTAKDQYVAGVECIKLVAEEIM